MKNEKKSSNKAPISVIITTFNDYEYLDQAIKSVLAQSLLPSELIVIDDGSDLAEAETITNRFIENNKGVSISFYRKENGGASSSRNLGIQKAIYDYIAFLDVDDKMLPNNLLDKYNLIENLDESYFGVYGSAIRSTGEIENFPDIDGVADADKLDIQGEGIPGGSPFFLFNKSSLIQVNGFDEKLKCNEDYDILIRLIKTEKRVKGCVPAGFYRNIRPNSLSRPANPTKLFERVMFFLEKAERLNYYSIDYLNQRKMSAYITYTKGLLGNKEFIKAFRYARKGFKYSKPVTNKQKLVYLVSFQWLW
ncbi:glycosyltransferase family 2 protein [Arcobacter vandammei]|uniref:glycosyltransferase family 2 protein n=1 Tax=Arcobacter vandammei TaxID=2782243 RepID=UPI0018DFE5BF|nr:glycosyltransferase family A protein [Arcobacter vandammei]